MKRNRTSILALILVICVVIGLAPGVLAYDDTDGHWGTKAIDTWTERGIIGGDGDGNFRPDASINRGEAAKVVTNLLGVTSKVENTFDDLEDDVWYTEFVLKAAAIEAMTGYGDGTIRPQVPISRQEAAKVVAEALGIKPVSTAAGFDDDDKISEWAMGYIAALKAEGIVSGYDGRNFGPTDEITRAALVTMVDNAVAEYIQEAGTYSGKYDGIVIVMTEGVVFNGATISGNLIVSEQVTAEGAVTLTDTKVEGDTIIGSGNDKVVVEKNKPTTPGGNGGNPPTYYASVDGTNYTSVANALAALEDGSTFTLLRNASHSGTIALDGDMNITLKGDGNTLTSDGIVISSGKTVSLTFDNITLKGGITVEDSNTALTLDGNVTIIDDTAAITVVSPYTHITLSGGLALTYSETADAPTILVENFYFGAFPEFFITNNTGQSFVGTPRNSCYYAYKDSTLVPDVAVRPVGDAGTKDTPDYIQEYDYAAAYAEAGITVEVDNSTNIVTITTDLDKLNTYTAGNAGNLKHIWPNSDTTHAAGPVVGLIFATPEDAMYFSINGTKDTDPLFPVSGSDVSANSFGGNRLRYSSVASGTLGSYTVLANNSMDYTVEFYDKDVTKLSETIEYTIEWKYTGVSYAQVEGKYYADLAAAVTAAGSATDSTVTLMSDYTLTSPLVIPNGVTLDGGGNTITYTGTAIRTETQKDDITIKDVTFSGEGIAIHVNASEVTLDGTIDLGAGYIQISGDSAASPAKHLTIADGAAIQKADECYAKPAVKLVEHHNEAYTEFVTDENSDTIFTAGTMVGYDYCLYVTAVNDIPAVTIRHNDPNGFVNYAQMYEDAGISYEVTNDGITISVDETKLTAIDPALANSTNAVVGLIFNTPLNAVRAEVTWNDDVSPVSHDLTEAIYAQYAGSLIEYFIFATESSGIYSLFTDTDELAITFYDESDVPIGNTITLTVTIQPAA